MVDADDEGNPPDDAEETADIPSQAVLRIAAGRSLMGPFGLGGGARRCSFCSRREASVSKLVQSRGVYICDSCVELAAATIDESPPADKLLRMRPRARLTIDRDAAEEAIERAYETVFAGRHSDRERCAAIESGDDLLPTMREVAERFGGRDLIDIAVNAIRFLDDAEAEVNFLLILSGQGHTGMGLPAGYAVLQDGAWKVARDTYAAAVARIGIQLPPSAPDGT